MPFLFIRWLLCRFAWNVAIMGVALTTILTLFDLLAHASEVSLGGAPPLLSLLFYELLRLPSICVFILPFAVLIAAVQTFGSLAGQREIIALESSGFTLPRITLILVAGAGALAVLQFGLADQIVTGATERLNEWKADGYRGLPKLDALEDSPEWLASGNFIIQLVGVSADGSELYSPTVIETDDMGVATRYWNARAATYDGDGWILEDVTGRDLERKTELHYRDLRLPLAIAPRLLSSFAKPVEELRFSQLRTLGWKNIETQIHPPELYRVWTNYRLAQPMGGMVMVLLAAPIGLQVQRNGRRILVSIGVFFLGFLYFILQSILLSLGEGGDLPPMLAAWGAFAVFGGTGLAALLFRLR
jgi:lipopolysaccharide export system permease protein